LFRTLSILIDLSALALHVHNMRFMQTESKVACFLIKYFELSSVHDRRFLTAVCLRTNVTLCFK